MALLLWGSWTSSIKKGHKVSFFLSFILTQKMLFVRVYIKQYWQFLIFTTKLHYTHFSEFISHNTLSGSYYKYYTFSQSLYQTTLTPPELLPNSTVKQYFFISFYQTKLTFSESYNQILQTFSTEDVPDNTSFFLRCEIILNLYWLG